MYNKSTNNYKKKVAVVDLQQITLSTEYKLFICIYVCILAFSI